jgi:hypothetical protein
MAAPMARIETICKRFDRTTPDQIVFRAGINPDDEVVALFDQVEK